MRRRGRDLLKELFFEFINQRPPPSDISLKYVAALRARIDVLETEIVLTKAGTEIKIQ